MPRALLAIALVLLTACTNDEATSDASGAPATVPGVEVEREDVSLPEQQTRALEALDAELETARRAASALAEEPRLSRAGYHLGSYWSRGVGTHYIDWRLVGAPFDPARPAMLLVDTAPGHKRRLAGFSYWVGSEGPPEGFDGDSDTWHHHRGLCFLDGVLSREGIADPADCGGVWVDGQDLWMLHVWVVPGYENPDGVFAPLNPKLCPPRTGIDAAFC